MVVLDLVCGTAPLEVVFGQFHSDGLALARHHAAKRSALRVHRRSVPVYARKVLVQHLVGVLLLVELMMNVHE